MKKLLTVVFLIIGTFTLKGQNTDQKTDRRQVIQRARIVDGVVDGNLTRREAHALRKEQRHIRRVERRAKADGKVTSRERLKLNRKQNKANRHIRRAKNNGIERI